MPDERPLPEASSLRIELSILQDEHDKALAMATYLGMTPEQAFTADERRKRINQLRWMLETQY